MAHALLISMTVALLFASCRNDQRAGRISREVNTTLIETGVEKDAELVRELAASNFAEIEMAKTAAQKTENKEVKDLAVMIEAAHRTFVSELKQYAAKRHMDLPGAASKHVTDNVRELAEKNKPDDFDKKWCVALLDKHEQTISAMEYAAVDATDPDLKVWINATLPKIRQQREKLMECNSSLR